MVSSLNNESLMTKGILSLSIDKTRNFSREEAYFEVIAIIHNNVHFTSISTRATVEADVGDCL